MKNLYILDAVNILFRSYYAIKGMTNLKGESTNALYGFIRSVYKLIKEFSPDHLVAVFDGPDNKRRRIAMYKEYKSNRAGMPEDLFIQLERALQFCKLAGIPYLSVEGVEADDTMGSIAKWSEKKKVPTYICTSDKDMCQLVSEHVFVINLHKENLLLDRAKVKEIYGIYPEQVPDFLGLTGDASDNIPGLEGFGPKTAISLLEEMGTLEAILEHPEKIKGEKKQEIVKNGREIALLSRELATIHFDVEFPTEEVFFALKAPHLEEIKAFYHDMHFLSLLKEIDDSAAPSSSHKQTVHTETTSYITIESEQALDELMDALQKEPEICLDTETTDIRPMHASLVGIGFCIRPAEAWYLPLNGPLERAKVIRKLKHLFENPHISFYGHNIKYDLHVLLNAGLPLPSVCFDTMVASYLLSPEKQRHNLDDLTLEKFGKVKIPITDLIGKGKNQIGMQEVEISKIRDYCCEDVDYTCRLKMLFEKELAQKELSSLFLEVELPLIPVLLRMERTGIFVDKKMLSKMSEEFGKALAILSQTITELAGESFNLNSPKQLSHILFDKLGIKPPKKTATGFSTSADVLEELQEDSPIVQEILRYRTLEKLRSTYIDALPDEINPQTNRIHCTFNQSVAATGRLSCQNPNLQNIPIRTQEGKKIREAFQPERSGSSFLAGDYSQIELRLLAHLSEDPHLIQAFQENQDIHAFTASLVHNIPLSAVSPEMRHQAKAVNFGILYGQQAFGLSKGLGVNFHEAAEFIEKYFLRYKRVKEFFDFCKESARKTGRAVTLTGRQRPIPEINNKNPLIRAAAERLAVNTPLQGTAADLIKIAMVQLDELLQKDNSLGSMILQIHDELLFEVEDTHVQRLKKVVKEIMENVFVLKVPLIVDISIGKNWEEC